MNERRLRDRLRTVAPFYRLWTDERRRHAETRNDLAAHAAHFQLAVAQREAERVLRVEAEERTAEVRRQLAFWMDIRADTLPDASEYGAWLGGEGRA